jgi:hypothetical protein
MTANYSRRSLMLSLQFEVNRGIPADARENCMQTKLMIMRNADGPFFGVGSLHALLVEGLNPASTWDATDGLLNALSRG